MPDRETDETPTGRVAGRPALHESGDALLRTPNDPDDGTVAETGTTVVALTAGDAAVLAADRRASVGGGRFVANRNVRKVEPVHPAAATAGSGTVGHLQRFNETLAAEARLYENRRGESISLEALAQVAGNLLGSNPLRVVPLLAGVGSAGPRVYELDGGGGVLDSPYAASGSGMQLAYGVLEREYETSIEVDGARRVAGRAVGAASERDTASGDGLTLAVVTGEGIELSEHDAVEEVAA